MKLSVVLGIALIFLAFCDSDINPKVIYPENETIQTRDLEKDTTRIEVADMPIHIDSTKYLIHPVGEYRMYGSRGQTYFGSSNQGSGSFYLVHYNRYEITGDLHNFKFQSLGTDQFISLTTKNIRINSITFLREVFENTKK